MIVLKGLAVLYLFVGFLNALFTLRTEGRAWRELGLLGLLAFCCYAVACWPAFWF